MRREINAPQVCHLHGGLRDLATYMEECRRLIDEFSAIGCWANGDNWVIFMPRRFKY